MTVVQGGSVAADFCKSANAKLEKKLSLVNATQKTLRLHEKKEVFCSSTLADRQFLSLCRAKKHREKCFVHQVEKHLGGETHRRPQ